MEEETLFPKVFLWLFIGLFISFLAGFYISINPNMIYNIFNAGLYLPIVLVEIGLVIFLTARINKMSYTSAVISYLIYSLVSGITLSMIFVIYAMTSIISVFAVTALIFLLFAGIGFATKIDLSKMGSIALMGLIGVILVSIVNIFLGNSMINLLMAVVSILIFVAFIAYDIQKIKRMSYNIVDPKKMAIIGALQLYLDFINIFLRLIQIFGRRKN